MNFNSHQASKIGNDPFLLSYMNYDEEKYGDILKQKIDCAKEKFLANEKISDKIRIPIAQSRIICSPPKYFRQRCRFAISTIDDNAIEPCYLMWESGSPCIQVDKFPIASIQINNMMPLVLSLIVLEEELYSGLKAVHFLSSSIGHIIISLVYEKILTDSTWLPAAQRFMTSLQNETIPCIDSNHISLIGRSKKVKLVVGRDWVEEEIRLEDGRILSYKQVDSGFSNPNNIVNGRVLDWMCDVVRNWCPSSCANTDLLEMYCGNGNHTIALAGNILQSTALIPLAGESASKVD